jgi:hypothetical protein
MTVSRIQQFELQLQQEIARERAGAILDESPPLLRAKVDWIRRTFEDDWRRSVVCRYQVAVALREVYDDVTANATTRSGRTRTTPCLPRRKTWARPTSARSAPTGWGDTPG